MEPYAHYFETNKHLWNKKTAIHKTSAFYDREGFVAGRNVLMPIELGEMGTVTGKSLLHLQCHFGMDTLSWARMGAWVTGVDFSESAIHEAQLLAHEVGQTARFVCCNVYDTRQHIAETFDIVFTSYGTIGWLPDLDKWAQIISESLNKWGVFYMADFHPVVWMMDDELTHIKYPYYNQQVIETESVGTYTNRDADINGKEYGWNHSISEILNSLISHGLEIEFFNEHYYSPYNCFSNTVETAPGQWQVKGLEGLIPMVYSLKAVKK